MNRSKISKFDEKYIINHYIKEFKIDDIPTNNKKEKKEKTKYYEYEYLLDSFIGEDANMYII